jgi:heme/copper-type cytochrome/quinol oxidase subunit 3
MRELIGEYYGTRTRRVTGLFIAANFAFFAALLCVMFYLRWVSEEWPAPFHFGSLLMVFAMTMFAVCGSATVAIGARAAKTGEIEAAVRWVAIAISSWFVFLFLEIVEWVRLVYLERLGPGTSFGSTFLLLTGTHWVAAALCIGWFTYAIVDVRKRDILAAGMYSHFLNVWWLVLVVTLYFMNFTFEGI